MRINIIAGQFRIDNFRFFLFFDLNYFFEVEQGIKHNLPGRNHYFDCICSKVGITKKNILAKKITVHPDDERSMLKKISVTGLNLEKFVFLSPESASNQLYDDNFWDLLIKNLKEKGYDIFINLTKDDINLSRKEDYKTCYLTFAETFALARQARKIIALRSGLIEWLLQTNVPIDVLYTGFRHRSIFGRLEAHHVMSGFGINRIPLVDKSRIQEFNMLETTQADYLQQVI